MQNDALSALQTMSALHLTFSIIFQNIKKKWRKLFHELFCDPKIVELLTDPEEPGLFYRQLCYSFIHSLTHPFLPNLQNIITFVTRTRTTVRARELNFERRFNSYVQCSAVH